MNPVIEKRLFRHINHDIYDKRGYIDCRHLRENLGIKIKDLAMAVGVTPRTLEKNPRSEKAQTSLRKIAYIYSILEEMIGSEEGALVWLRAPNPDYDGASPLEIISQGKVDAIMRYLDDIKKGALT